MDNQLPAWLTSIAHADDIKKLDMLKADLLGKSGIVTHGLKQLGQLSPEDRKAKGAEINRVRDTLLNAFQERYKALDALHVAQKLQAETIDMTLPSPKVGLGRLHPLTVLMNDIQSFFEKRGFSFVQGPEIDDEWHNFDALNIPEHHPARQNHDTFYMQASCDEQQEKNRRLLRTHTSTVQIRSMMTKKPPLRLISMGRVYRSDDLDATHTPMFHQVEGLVIDKGIHMGHLKGLLRDFCSALFGVDDAPIRMRPSFFPFTEPSAEVDVACTKKDGRLIMGEGGGWMELLGCGMVHPHVLQNCGIDPNEYQGFAFGMGIERLCMIKNGMTDIRQLYEGDERWMHHFGSLA